MAIEIRKDDFHSHHQYLQKASAMLNAYIQDIPGSISQVC